MTLPLSFYCFRRSLTVWYTLHTTCYLIRLGKHPVGTDDEDGMYIRPTLDINSSTMLTWMVPPIHRRPHTGLRRHDMPPGVAPGRHGRSGSWPVKSHRSV